jgi:hypothetical protein
MLVFYYWYIAITLLQIYGEFAKDVISRLMKENVERVILRKEFICITKLIEDLAKSGTLI